MGRPAVVVAARRSAIGRVGGHHRHVPLGQLAAPVIRAALEDARLAVSEVDALVMGNAWGPGGNPARLAALAAGLPPTTFALTIDTQCTSGLEAIAYAARLVETGPARVVVAGGAESASTAPWRVAKPANLYTDPPAFYEEAPFAPGALGNPSMIEGAEAVARACLIGRDRQDAFALESHRRAATPESRRLAAAEIAQVGPGAEADEGVRPGLRAALLARMPPLLPGGSVTAGNSCAISDGAAFVIVMAQDAAQDRGLAHGLRVAGCASAGGDPALPGLALVPAVERLGLTLSGAAGAGTEIAITEAFAAQALAACDALGIDPAHINPQGGALALGHPYAASGAVLAVQLFSRLVRCGGPSGEGAGLAAAAGAGGVGAAILFEKIKIAGR